ncbi:MAG: glycerophosphodiester phosphodiesterase [Acidimicrobiales bacterium]
MTGPPILVAHRAGNHPDSARLAVGRADLIELDVHVRRGRVELRHAKVLWPTSRLWERWYLLPRDTEVVLIQSVLDELEADTPLQLDLKCFTARAAKRIRSAVGDGRPLHVSSRSWHVLRAFRGRENTVAMRSCASPRQLWLARRLPGLGDRVGIVAHERLLDRATVRSVRSATSVLFTWAVRSPERAEELSEAGITGLIVDDLDLDWPRRQSDR